MYSLLIVDDELPVVQGLLADLDTEKLEIDHVYKAYNIRQAKQILTQHYVDMMLCDIEMPQGTGLELLEWANTHVPNLQTIFLTSHEDFRYAKQALKLGSLDYLLKPVPDDELEQALGKAKLKLSQDLETTRLERWWSSNRSSMIEQFWTELLQQVIASSPDAIKAAIEERNVPYTERMTFLPILISVRRWHKPLTVRDEKIMEYALRKTAFELIAGEEQGAQLISLERGTLLFLLPVDSQAAENGIIEQLQEACRGYVQSCHRYFYCDLSCYIGNMVMLHEMVSALSQLRMFESNNVVYDNTVSLLTGYVSSTAVNVPMPDMRPWVALLKSGMKEQVLAEMKSYLEERIERSEVNGQMLQQLHQNFLQTIYFVMMAKGRTANELFGDAVSMELSRKASTSVADMLHWIEYTVNKALSRQTEAQTPHHVVENVKTYIVAHLDQSDLTREEIAQHAFLNPDYLARIFKKETGKSIMEFLLQERIGMAKELLLKTDLSIGDIAASVGYSHFSHFSRTFRKQTGMNPNEYRQAHSRRSGACRESR